MKTKVTVLLSLMSELRRRRRLVSSTADLVTWGAASIGFAMMRYPSPSLISWGPVLAGGLLTGLLFISLGLIVHLHQGRASAGSLDELVLMAPVALAAGLIVFAVNLAGGWVARSVPLGATLLFILMASFVRAAWRMVGERDELSARADGASRVLVVGAGEAGRELIGSMLRDPKRQWRPIGFLDDDPNKRHLRYKRVPVLGRTDDLEQVAATHGFDSVVVAIPSASASFVKRTAARAGKLGVVIKVLPATTQMLTDNVGIRDIRDIDLTDVLGRNQLDTDIGSIADYLTGRRVLVTGAGGSIGAELCRQISRFQPAELMMLDRDESALHAVQLSIEGRALLDSRDVVLCDIRDVDAVQAVFDERKPEVVFHAAALKHLPMLEQYPGEAVKTNVIGTRTVLRAARSVGVDRFVNISTDKAANPSSVLGYSKRLAERITASCDEHADGTYLSVRFGNVLGSRGSVLTSFAKQIAAGGPVTVTHPDVTRYFMTIEEACQLVIQAAAIGRGGEVLVLDMGEPKAIVDIATSLIEQAGRPIAIELTGLRPGEKLHEELFGLGEPTDERPSHPMICHVPVPSIGAEQIANLPCTGSQIEIVAALQTMCRQPEPDADAQGPPG